ncbi:MAG: DUF2285 domain-containing protein [Hyphomicrobium denitrificans]|nr:DUF2285 domain-containing protein [Hyphomicrobium denitrificans]
MTIADFLDKPPGGAALTTYDRAHLKLYLRLLDADAEGADWKAVVEALFGICPGAEPERAARIHTAHLARAKWMTTSGYSELLDPSLH